MHMHRYFLLLSILFFSRVELWAQSDSVLPKDSIKTYSFGSITIEGTRVRPRPSATTLDAKEIQKRNLGQDIPYLLQNTPSAIATSDAGTGIGYTGLRIRGSDATRTNVTLNGVPVNDPESQGTFYVDLPDLASSVQDVQVQRGVGSSTNGSGAFGASVNVQTKGTQDTAFATVTQSVGSFNTWRQTYQAGTGLMPGTKLAVDARLSALRSDGYIDRASARLASHALTAAWTDQAWSLKAVYLSGKEKTYQAWYGLPVEMLSQNRRFNIAGTDWFQKDPAYDNETDNYRQDYYQLHFNALMGRGWSLGVSPFYTRGLGYYEQYKVGADMAAHGIQPLNLDSGSVLNGAVIQRDTAITTTDLIRTRWLDNHYLGTVFNLKKQWTGLTLYIGGMGARFRNFSYGQVEWARFAGQTEIRDRYYRSPSNKVDMNLYGKLFYTPSNRLTVDLDLQVRRVEYRIGGFENTGVAFNFDTTWLFFNPKMNAGYRFAPGASIQGGVSVAHREPTRTAITEARSGMPKSERLYDFEIGVSKEKEESFRASVNGYYMLYKDQLVPTGQLNDVGNTIFQNVQDSYRAGLELEGALLMTRWIEPRFSLTLSRNKIGKWTDAVPVYGRTDVTEQTLNYAKTDIAFSPGMIGLLGLTTRPVAGLEAELIGRYVSRQYLDNTQSSARTLPAYAVADLRIAYSLPVKRLRLASISLLVNNLFSTMYSSNGYTYYDFSPGPTDAPVQNSYNYVYPQAGRNFLLSLTIGI